MMRKNDEINDGEIVIRGIPGAPGITMGGASLYQREDVNISSAKVPDHHIEEEIDRFYKAQKLAQCEFEELLERQDDENAIELVRMQLTVLNDPDLSQKVETRISKHQKPADAAIRDVFEEYLVVLQQQEAERQRGIDVSDIRDRLIEIVNNHEREGYFEGDIVVAHELSPREVIEFSERDIKGIVTDQGGKTSHAAIIARSMNIPAVLGLKDAINHINSRAHIILDGEDGKVIINPTEETREKYEQLKQDYLDSKEDLEAICDKPNVTKDGQPYCLRANIEFTEELEMAQKYQAEGVGLFRTESIYLRHDNFRDCQQSFYEVLLDKMDPHPVIIRLLDAGGDKFFGSDNQEQNPFLGWRGIRMLLDKQDMLCEQLTAILKSTVKNEGRLRVLVPMVSTLEEFLQVQELVAQITDDLQRKGTDIPDKPVQLGIMVEVPSVALQLKTYAKHADFFSIGTNDLTQYTLAVDRGNEFISKLYDQRHPAVWQMIKHIADGARETNTPLSVCGELASDPVAACCLVGLDIYELSMNPFVLPKVKKMLCSRSADEMKELSRNVLNSETLGEVRKLFAEWR